MQPLNSKIQNIDRDGDGNIDGQLVDQDGDGRADIQYDWSNGTRVAYLDSGGTGMIDAVCEVSEDGTLFTPVPLEESYPAPKLTRGQWSDTNEDGKADALAVDNDGDDRADLEYRDLDFDGTFDHAYIDSDDNGSLDMVFKVVDRQLVQGTHLNQPFESPLVLQDDGLSDEQLSYVESHEQGANVPAVDVDLAEDEDGMDNQFDID